MDMTYLSDRQEKDAFAQRAARCFRNNQSIWIFTEGDIAPGEYFAMRFGLGNDCVVVFRIGDDMPINYQQLINQVEDGE